MVEDHSHFKLIRRTDFEKLGGKTMLTSGHLKMRLKF